MQDINNKEIEYEVLWEFSVVHNFTVFLKSKYNLK